MPIVVRNIFRFWPKAFLMSAKNRASCAAFLKLPREISETRRMAESTFGGGENAPAGTVFIYFGVPYAFIERESMLSFLLRAILSPTSFCIKKTSVDG